MPLSDNGCPDVLKVVTESPEHLVLQVAEVDLDFGGEASSVAFGGEVEPPLHPAEPVRQDRVEDPRDQTGRVIGDDDGVRGYVQAAAAGEFDGLLGAKAHAQLHIASRFWVTVLSSSLLASSTWRDKSFTIPNSTSGAASMVASVRNASSGEGF